MHDIVFNMRDFFFGILGVLIGGIISIYCVRLERYIASRTKLKGILISQLCAIKNKAEDYQDILTRHFPDTRAAYEELYYISCTYRRFGIERAWKIYKGNDNKYLPIFSKQKFTRFSNTSVMVETNPFPDYNEIENRLIKFIESI